MIAGLITTHFLANRLEAKLLDYQTDHLHLTAEAADIAILKGRVSLENVHLRLLTKTDSILLNASGITLRGISYTGLLLSNSIALNKIQLDSAQLLKKPLPFISTTVSDSLKTSKDWSVGNITANHLQFTNLDKTGDTLIMVNNMQCRGIKAGMKQNQLTLGYKQDFTLSTDVLSLVKKDGTKIKYHRLSIHPDSLRMYKISIHPGYTKRAYSKHIPYQKDWIALSIDSLHIKYNSPPTLPLKELSINKLETYGLYLQAYRDKFVPRKEIYKPLYSKMLRELPVKFTIDTLMVHHSKIEYEELVNTNQRAGRITLNPVDAYVFALHNTDTTKTTFQIRAGMLGAAVLDLRGGFNVKDTLDRFYIHAQIEDIAVENFKSFTVPNMNMTATGQIDRLNYTMNGNDHNAGASLQLQYTDLNVRLLQKNGKADKKLISALANVLVKRDKYMPKPIQYSVERNQNRSLINFIWVCLAEGLKQTLI